MTAKLSACSAPTPNNRVLWVEKLKGQSVEKFVVTSAKLYGFHTHWTGVKTVPCWENHDFCYDGHSTSTLRENFLLQAWSFKRSKQVFVYLTPAAAQQLLDQVATGDTLNGLTIAVSRSKQDNGRLNVHVEGYVDKKKNNAHEVDPFLSIMRFLKVPRELQNPARSLGTIPQEDMAEAG